MCWIISDIIFGIGEERSSWWCCSMGEIRCWILLNYLRAHSPPALCTPVKLSSWYWKRMLLQLFLFTIIHQEIPILQRMTRHLLENWKPHVPPLTYSSMIIWLLLVMILPVWRIREWFNSPSQEGNCILVAAQCIMPLLLPTPAQINKGKNIQLFSKRIGPLS